mmetsp:Transcript_82362/g.164620  ORF Transcript_82362/g.164620 Transcript_82362/m.164620 type:complete len:185 (-) Transcript_82362:11-565(-)
MEAVGGEDFVLSVRIGRRKDPVRRQVDIAMKCLLREVVVKVERENEDLIAGCLGHLVGAVVERASRRERNAYSNYTSKALALALELDNGLGYEYCPPLPPKQDDGASEAANKKKVRSKSSIFSPGKKRDPSLGGSELEWVAVQRPRDEWADWQAPNASAPNASVYSVSGNGGGGRGRGGGRRGP